MDTRMQKHANNMPEAGEIHLLTYTYFTSQVIIGQLTKMLHDFVNVWALVRSGLWMHGAAEQPPVWNSQFYSLQVAAVQNNSFFTQADYIKWQLLEILFVCLFIGFWFLF